MVVGDDHVGFESFDIFLGYDADIRPALQGNQQDIGFQTGELCEFAVRGSAAPEVMNHFRTDFETPAQDTSRRKTRDQPPLLKKREPTFLQCAYDEFPVESYMPARERFSRETVQLEPIPLDHADYQVLRHSPIRQFSGCRGCAVDRRITLFDKLRNIDNVIEMTVGYKYCGGIGEIFGRDAD